MLCFVFVFCFFHLFNNPISSSICELPIRSEIYNCTSKNTNKVSRTLPDIQDLLEPLEDAISHMLIPAITERKCNQLDRNILALPVRLGGLGLGNPSLEARREYASSVKVTKPLVEQIVSQSHQLPEDSLTKLA